MTGSLASVVGRLIGFYQGTIVVYAILSWFAGGSTGAVQSIYRALAVVCEPFIGIFRRLLPTALVGGSGVDFSPLVAILVLSLLQRLAYTLL